MFRYQYPHNFPVPHPDFLAQTISYQVPIEKLCDIARFDGSVIVDRTAGEVIARCHMESMNILSLNLMHDIVTSSKSVEARKAYADNASAYMMNRPAPYAERFQFDLPKGDTSDQDESNITGSMTSEVMEKVKDFFR